MPEQSWERGELYEPYVGRWSRRIAERFVAGLPVAPGGRWVDVGCGTGALTGVLLADAAPAAVLAVDRSPGYLQHARRRLGGAGAGFALADARALPVRDGRADAAVSGLVLNFVPDPAAAVAELARVCRPGGTVAVYLWDYAEGMQAIRLYWDAAVAVDPAAAGLDEGRRFGLCRPEPMAGLLAAAGLTDVTTGAVTVDTPFRDFADYWTPFLGGQGPAPGHCAGLSPADRRRLRDRLAAAVPYAADGSLALTARAWVARGTVPARRRPVDPGGAAGGDGPAARRSARPYPGRTAAMTESSTPSRTDEPTDDDLRQHTEQATEGGEDSGPDQPREHTQDPAEG